MTTAKGQSHKLASFYPNKSTAITNVAIPETLLKAIHCNSSHDSGTRVPVSTLMKMPSDVKTGEKIQAYVLPAMTTIY